jgi:hypothetical protein
VNFEGDTKGFEKTPSLIEAQVHERNGMKVIEARRNLPQFSVI